MQLLKIVYGKESKRSRVRVRERLRERGGTNVSDNHFIVYNEDYAEYSP